ncbi:MAG: two-component system, NtrC family, sensor histidine kinase PilS [Gammaproteobacteria bacterium]|nr:two-component system, NtrC family, sensor histidine kinase PilS [Gammaproteobacteria bacterium]
MPVNAASAPSTPTDLAWRVIGLLNLYRLLVPIVLIAVQALARPHSALLTVHPRLFLSACVAYLAAAMLLIIARRLEWSSLRFVALVNSGVDAAAIGLILYASGGVSSGLGILLVLPVGAMAVLADHRDAFLIAAVAAIAVLIQQIFVNLEDAASTTDYTTAGVLGAVLFLIALSAWPIANRLRESEALVRRQEVDLANLAQLSQYIVQHLRESILVIDTHDRIRLINESAAHILGDTSAVPEALLGEASPRLLYLLETWRQNQGSTAVFPPSDQTFVGADGARVIRANFAPLGSSNPAPVIVFLEDTSLLVEKVQQSKLAALGRLSASIAHEIRNPVGAMSHAAQLLGESSSLTSGEKRLTEIMRTNADRVSAIINNVLSLSKRAETRAETISLQAWTEEFHQEFCETMQLSRERLRTDALSPVEVRVDPSQLRQIVWNLCENAFKHGVADRPEEIIEIRHGRLTPTGRPYLQVMDRGAGVNPDHAERIFEPFFSGGRGTGLGLFLARELAQTNGATLLYEPRHGGGSIFRLVFADPRRWEAR